MPSLVDLVAKQCDAMDAANVSHAYTRVAKLYHSAQPIPQPTSTALRAGALDTVKRLTERLPRVVGEFDTWGVASTLWALSELKFYDKAVFDMLCSKGAQMATDMKPVDCMMLMTAFGRFGHYHPELLRYIPQVKLNAKMTRQNPITCSSLSLSLARRACPWGG